MLLKKVLETLGDGVVTSLDLIEVILEAPYGTSAAGYEYRMRQKKRRRAAGQMISEEDIQRCRNFIGYLRRDGLIKVERGKDHVRLTVRGRLKLNRILGSGKVMLPTVAYDATPSESMLIVCYDVPEKVKYKRVWLQRALLAAGFEQLQESLYAGKVKLPLQLLNDMRHLRLEPHVEIFQITRAGTLRHLL